MSPERREAIARWRDATLVKTYGDESAASRLAEHGPLAEGIDAALAIDAPAADELIGCDVRGEPLDPLHPWWGHRGPSWIEKEARRRGLPWPPDDDPNPYAKKPREPG